MSFVLRLILLVTADCKRWHQKRSAKSQADAFVNITCNDFRLSLRGVNCLSECWTKAAEEAHATEGARAYAHQQATMYARMRDNCETEYERTRKPGVDRDTLDHSLVRATRLFSCLWIGI